MTKKSKLVVLTDANVVIHAHENNYWESLCAHHNIVLPATVIEDELFFFSSETGKKGFTVSKWVREGKVTRIEAELKNIELLQKKLKSDFLDTLHNGELEALAILLSSNKHNDIRFTTADKAAIKA